MITLRNSRKLNDKEWFQWLPKLYSYNMFKILSMYFCYFVIISPCKRAWPFIWTNLNSLNWRVLWAEFGWNWPSGSGEVDFLILTMYFFYFVIISPWKRCDPSFEQISEFGIPSAIGILGRVKRSSVKIWMC